MKSAIEKNESVDTVNAASNAASKAPLAESQNPEMPDQNVNQVQLMKANPLDETKTDYTQVKAQQMKANAVNQHEQLLAMGAPEKKSKLEDFNTGNLY